MKDSIDGHVTLLDFGLAKERRSGPARGDDRVEGVVLADLSRPTIARAQRELRIEGAVRCIKPSRDATT